MNERVEALLFAIVQSDEADQAIEAVTREGWRATRVSSSGGFLRAGNATLLLGLPSADINRAVHLLSETCRKRTIYLNAMSGRVGYQTVSQLLPIEAEVGGATIFVLPVERYVRLGTPRVEYSAAPPTRKEGAMKLMLAIVPEDKSDAIMSALTAAQTRVTLISTTGGFLRKGNATLVIGVEAEKVAHVMDQIQHACEAPHPPALSDPACATVFVLDVEQHLRV